MTHKPYDDKGVKGDKGDKEIISTLIPSTCLLYSPLSHPSQRLHHWKNNKNNKKRENNYQYSLSMFIGMFILSSYASVLYYLIHYYAPLVEKNPTFVDKLVTMTFFLSVIIYLGYDRNDRRETIVIESNVMKRKKFSYRMPYLHRSYTQGRIITHTKDIK